jgi:hypothetical protein
MDSLTDRRYAALQHVCSWANEVPTLFRPGTPAARCLAQIQAAIHDVLRAHLDMLDGIRCERGAPRAACRRALREALLTLRRAAQILEAMAPGTSLLLDRPPYRNDDELIEFANGLLRDLQRIGDRLLGALDLPDDFFDTIRRHIGALEQAIADQSAARRKHVAAVRSADAALARGFKALESLDILMRLAFARNPIKLNEWKGVRRIPRRRGRRRGTAARRAA